MKPTKITSKYKRQVKGKTEVPQKRSKKQSKRKKPQASPQEQALTQSIITLFSSNPRNVWNYKQVSKRLGIADTMQRLVVSNILMLLAYDDVLLEVSPGSFRYNVQGAIIEGTFVRKPRGTNVIIPQEGGKPVIVAERNSLHALPGDKVRARLFAKRPGAAPEAEVIEIVQRKRSLFVGCIQMRQDWATFITEDREVELEMIIPKDKLKGAEGGSKVVVHIIEWAPQSKVPTAEVIDILGKAGENNAEMMSILVNNQLPYTYPKEVEEAAEKLPGGIAETEWAHREDFRKVLTFTIDPADAKDFDDALSFQVTSDGKYEVGVHIADVSFYVTEGDLIDQEAYERATSIYLVDRTIPMLPERLCNDLCSLKPNEDRYAYSCIFKLNEEAEVESYRIARTVIHSDRRYSYEEAQQIIETGSGDYAEAILKINELAKQLRKKRLGNGAINFESQEVKFILDDKGVPLSVMVKESKDANHLIEEFMLLANKTVAREIGQIRLNKNQSANSFVYRIHAQPEREKLATFAAFVGSLGYKINASATGSKLSNSFNKLLSDIHGQKEEKLISTLAIRSMARAEYSTHNIGHYGLAFDFYTHFTSPIRRYPDLMVHRLLTRYLSGGNSVDANELEERCKHCSQQEQVAANAERDSIKYKQIEYMSTRVGKVFDGIISGVTEWGLYVELKESHCEGLIPMRALEDDFFEYDEHNHCLIGRRSKQKYSLGDGITIRVVRADLNQKQLDFEPV